jgi:type II secretory ATPase GspE/PulE/Tfp pilus assembly ATPase PilB-like protein
VLCSACRKPHTITTEERSFFARAGIDPPPEAQIYTPVGCEACEDDGFVGRVGIFEFLETDERIRDLIRDRAPTQAILSAAIEAGMRTMFADGMRKCLEGITTLDEVCRVTEDW